MNIDAAAVWKDFQAIKKTSPLIHNITNYVVMEQTANSLLAIGASPVMAHAVEEVEEMARIANCLLLNIGTLSSSWIEGMEIALLAAKAKKIPIILDPVGAGATAFRTKIAKEIADLGVTAIRGNASEIVSMHNNGKSTRGVDSQLGTLEFLEFAKQQALKNRCTVWMSGKTDVITDGHKVILIHNGHPIMAKVTGMGCTASAVAGAFLAVNSNTLASCAFAASLMGVAGEIAARRTNGPGSFKPAFIDILYNISLADLQQTMRVETL